MTRTRLPSRRDNVNFQFRYGGATMIGALGFDRLRQPREVFLSTDKTTSELEAVGRDAAILVSLLLQHGGDFTEMRDAITRNDDGSAASLVGALLDEIEHVTEAEVKGLLK